MRRARFAFYRIGVAVLLGVASGFWFAPEIQLQIQQQIQTATSKWAQKAAKGLVHWSRLGLNYSDQHLELTVENLDVQPTPSLKFARSIESVAFRIDVMKSINSRMLIFEKIRVKQLHLEIQLNANQAKSDKHILDAIYTTFGAVSNLVDHRSIPIEFEQSDIQIFLTEKNPLFLSPDFMEFWSPHMTSSYRQHVRLSVSAPQIAPDRFWIDGELEKTNDITTLVTKSEVKKMSVAGLNQTILEFLIPKISKVISNGEASQVALQFIFSSEPSRFLFYSKIKNSELSLSFLPNPVSNLEGTISITRDEMKFTVSHAQFPGLELFDSKIELPIRSTSQTLHFDGTVQFKPIELSKKSIPHIIQSQSVSPWALKGRVDFSKSGFKSTEMQLRSSDKPQNKIDLSMIGSNQLKVSYQGFSLNDKHEIFPDQINVTDTIKTTISKPSKFTHLKHLLKIDGKLLTLNVQTFKSLIEFIQEDVLKIKVKTDPKKIVEISLSGQLEMKKLIYDHFQIESPNFVFHPTQMGTSIHVSGEYIDGNIDLPSDILSNRNNPINAKFSKFRVASSHVTSPKEAVQELKASQFDPTKVPSFNFFCNRLIVAGQLIGAVTVDLRATPDGIAVNEIIAEAGSYYFWSKEGQWVKKDQQVKAGFVGEIKILDMEDFSKHFGFSAQLGKSHGQAYFSVNWQNTVLPQIENLKGRMTFSLNDGKLPSRWSPFMSLIKIIVLDVKSTFDTGHKFSRFFGDLIFSGNTIKMSQVKLKLQAATLLFKGSIIPQKREVDLILEVTPKITNSFIGYAISPILYVMGELNIKRAWINRMFSHQYTVTGTFDNFKTKFLKLGRAD